MGWIYLVESGDLQLRYLTGLDLLRIVRKKHTVKEFCLAEWLKELLKSPQSGTMFHPFQWSIFQDKLISSLEDSHARTSALQALEKVWQESEVDYFSRCFTSAKKPNRLSYSLKMFPQLPVGEDGKLCKRFPRWGMIVDGVLYPLKALVHYTVGNVGSYLPTPRASDYKRQDSPSDRKRNSPSLTTKLNMIFDTVNQKISLKYLEWLMGYNAAHTELKPWAIQWYHSKRKLRSKS